MPFTFTPKATRQIQEMIAKKGGGLALRIDVSGKVDRPGWRMGFEAMSDQARWVGGVPVVAEKPVWEKLEGLIIDWVMTPDGAGFGVYDRALLKTDQRLRKD